MTPTDHEVEVLQPDGSTTVERRTLWSSEYGPIIDFPGLGWTATTTLTYRDANIDNDEFAEQYVAMMTAQSFDEFVAAHRDHQGVPLFNTIAVSNDGRAWYADTSATPNLSDEAEALYLERLDTDPITGIARENGVVLLDGSDSRFAWEEAPGARDPGLVPFDEMPMVERSDYVFNANDSFWMPHATEMLAGDYSRAARHAGHAALAAHAGERHGALGVGSPERRPATTARSRARSCATRRSPTSPTRPGSCASRSSSAAARRRSSTCPSCSATTTPSPCPPRASTSPPRAPCSPAGTVATTSTAAAPCCGARCSARCSATCRTGSTRCGPSRSTRPAPSTRLPGWRRREPRAIPCSPRWPAPCRR